MRALLCLCQLLVVMTVACGSSTRSPVEDTGGSGSSGFGGGGSGGNIEVVTGGGAHEPDGSQPAATLLALELEPAESTVLVDATLSLQVMAVYSNGEREDVRSRAQLASSDPELVSLSAYRLTARSPGVVTVTATLFGVSGTAKITVLPKTITAIAVTAAQASLSLGEALQAHAEALMDDGSRRDVTSLATWSSSDPQVARLTTSGFLIAMGRGTATVSATVGAVSGSVDQQVTGETLTAYTITGPYVLRVGDQSLVQLKVHYGSRVVTERDVLWQTSDASVVSLASGGLLAAVSAGTVTISAMLGSDVAATFDVVVTDAVLTSLALEGQRVFGFCDPPKLRVVGTFSDGSSYEVGALLDGGAFGSGAEVVGFASDDMSLLPKALGDVEIEVAVGDVWAIAQFTIVLGSPIRIVVDEAPPLPVAASTTLSAFAYCTDDRPAVSVTKLVTWSSDDPTVAAIASAGDGAEIVGVRPGTTSVHATYPGFEIEPISVSVLAGTPSELLSQPEELNFGAGSGSFPMRSLAW
jgi:trimeric autotransporter adhesin